LAFFRFFCVLRFNASDFLDMSRSPQRLDDVLLS